MKYDLLYGDAEHSADSRARLSPFSGRASPGYNYFYNFQAYFYRDANAYARYLKCFILSVKLKNVKGSVPKGCRRNP